MAKQVALQTTKEDNQGAPKVKDGKAVEYNLDVGRIKDARDKSSAGAEDAGEKQEVLSHVCISPQGRSNIEISCLPTLAASSKQELNMNLTKIPLPEIQQESTQKDDKDEVAKTCKSFDNKQKFKEDAKDAETCKASKKTKKIAEAIG